MSPSMLPPSMLRMSIGSNDHSSSSAPPTYEITIMTCNLTTVSTRTTPAGHPLSLAPDIITYRVQVKSSFASSRTLPFPALLRWKRFRNALEDRQSGHVLGVPNNTVPCVSSLPSGLQPFINIRPCFFRFYR